MVSSDIELERRLTIERVDNKEEFIAEDLDSINLYTKDGKHYCSIDDREHCISDDPILFYTLKMILKVYFRGPKKDDNQR